jgi:hypothetical protein
MTAVRSSCLVSLPRGGRASAARRGGKPGPPRAAIAGVIGYGLFPDRPEPQARYLNPSRLSAGPLGYART